MTDAPSVRIDKWLWAARFFKTRSLAIDAIAAGHVRRGASGSMAGDRVKPAQSVRSGDSYTIQRGDVRMDIVVTLVSDRRGSAADAALLFSETADSAAARAERQALRAAVAAPPVMQGRPTKHDRRKLAQLFAKNYAGTPQVGDQES
jgi:ribosome-associated heat shock protein Hsp15